MTNRQLLLVCAGAAAWALNFGLGSQAVSHWLKAQQASDSLVGLVHAVYYLGVAAASLLVPALTRRLGLGCAVLGMLVSALGLALFPATQGAASWLATRGLSGAGCALTLVPLETFVCQHSLPQRRTETFAYYAVALTLAGAVGIALGLECISTGSALADLVGPTRNVFFLGAIFPLVGSVIVQHGLVRQACYEDALPETFAFVWKDHFLSFGTAWAQGFLEGGLLAFLSLYLVAQGWSASTAGILMAVTMIGLIAFQVPVGWLADRLGRHQVLLACYAVVLAGLLAIPACRSFIWLSLCLFTLGACSGAMYPLGLALLGNRPESGAVARGYAWYLAIECLGSQFGAAAMGGARDVWGGWAMFPVGAVALAGVIILWGAGLLLKVDPSREIAKSHPRA